MLLKSLLPLLCLTSCFTSELAIRNETQVAWVPYPVVTTPPPPHRQAVPAMTIGVGTQQAIDIEGFNPLYYAASITDPALPNAIFIGMALYSDDPPLIQHKLMHYVVPPGQEGNDPALQPIVIADRVDEVVDENLVIRVFEGPVDWGVGFGWKVKIAPPGN